MQSSLGASCSPGASVVATGLDPLDEPSVVEIGILDRYIATWYPSLGETDEDVLQGLESLLDANGLPATYDPYLRVLSLDEDFGDSDTFYWSHDRLGSGGDARNQLRVIDRTCPAESVLSAVFVLGAHKG